jgi:penicillin-insensitive murein DD-endopeptidase
VQHAGREGPLRLIPLSLLLGLASLCGALGGCLGPGLLTDGTSVSVGTFTGGALRRGAALPLSGRGYVVPALWRDRGASFTTDEFAVALQRAAGRVVREYPGSQLGIADLSLRGGGDSELHRSHENGRDADIIWYACDLKGKPLCPADCMPRYDGRFQARAPRETPGVTFGAFTPRRFDVERNWALVRSLLTDPAIEVQYLFCHNRLRRTMLEHALRIGDDEEVIERAEAILRQPGDSLPHDDHLHVRIYCAPSDRAFGCRDQGPVRWWKKRYKYMPPSAPATPTERVIARLFTSRYFRAADRLR